MTAKGMSLKDWAFRCARYSIIIMARDGFDCNNYKKYKAPNVAISAATSEGRGARSHVAFYCTHCGNWHVDKKIMQHEIDAYNDSPVRMRFDFDFDNQCSGKSKFTTRLNANAFIVSLKIRGELKNEDGMEAYLCPHGCGWHIGHPNAVVKSVHEIEHART